MTRTGLIGHTGFVGGNLKHNCSFHALYNTQNIAEIRGQQFDVLVCAAPQAKKWWANQNPEADLELIQQLIEHLKHVAVDRLVLVSSIDVFPKIIDVDERFDCASQENHAYGRNRLVLEQFVSAQFPTHHILRLPGLFGSGLRKNVIFDLLSKNEVHKINPQSQFQWYDVTRLWADIQTAIQHNLPLVMLATEPIATGDIQTRYFPDIQIGAAASPALYYDVHTCYAKVFGGTGNYALSKAQVLDDLGLYIAAIEKAQGMP
jgi:nucleoside-diphosphate-sugar epimerase